MGDNLDWTKIFVEAKEKLGQVNIILAGKTGVGKSTLLNTVFGEDLAETGIGKPITQSIKEYSKEGSFYHLIDTKGFELKSYEKMKDDLMKEVDRRLTTDPKEHIHVMWYCINDEGKRIEPSELEFIKDISKKIPVILVFTKSWGDDVFYKKVKDDNYDCINYTSRVLALPVNTPIGTIPSQGLDKLVALTHELVPEVAKKAFAAAQKVNDDITKKNINKIIVGAAAAAATAGAVPIPFSDAIVLAPIQIGMIAGISCVFGLDLDDGFLKTIVCSAAGVTGATFLGKSIVTNLIKCIPVAGSIVGGVISAGTAATLTTLLGEAYYRGLAYLKQNNMEMSAKNISTVFIKELKSSK